MYLNSLVRTVLLPVVLLVGCATAVRVSPDDPTTSLVFVHIDVSQAPTDLRGVSLVQHAASGGQNWIYQLAVNDAVARHMAVAPGTYSFSSLGGVSTGVLGSQSAWTYRFDKPERHSRFAVPGPGVYFLGSFRLVVEKRGLLKDPVFNLESVNQPGEREVLQKMIAQIEADENSRRYVRQLRLAKQRLADLGARR